MTTQAEASSAAERLLAYGCRRRDSMSPAAAAAAAWRAGGPSLADLENQIRAQRAERGIPIVSDELAL